MPPEDVYQDCKPYSYVGSSTGHSRQDPPKAYKDIQASANYNLQYRQQENHALNPKIRQISAASASASAVSGSENWETYDDASEPEMDASEAYYAKVKAASTKRYTPEGGHSPKYGGLDKRFKDRHPAMAINGAYGNSNTYSASDPGWSDENVF